MIDYKSSGVDIEAGNEAVNRIVPHVKKTFSPDVLTGLGGYGGAYSILEISASYRDPVLVQSTDSVGTKVIIAKMMGTYKSIGRDLVGNVVGDILVMGAKPLTFLDYIANDHTDPAIIEQIVSGIAHECIESGMSLIGGETAELPGVYRKDEVDVVGFVTGVVERDEIITGEKITAGDIILGLPSNGLLTNGFSLARKVFFEIGKYGVESEIPEFEKTVGEMLLTPHVNYTKPIRKILDSGVTVNGMAHITGGGLLENIPRILPSGTAALLRKGSWPLLSVFDVIQQIGEIEEREMYRTFNMGIGIVIVASPNEAEKIKTLANTLEIGTIIEGQKTVTLI